MTSVLAHKRFYIGLARFNDATFEENKRWRATNNWKGCIYTPRKPISTKIPINSLLVVIEMNNQQNKIMGFGLIKNYRHPQQRVFMYSGNWQSDGKPYTGANGEEPFVIYHQKYMNQLNGEYCGNQISNLMKVVRKKCEELGFTLEGGNKGFVTA